MNPETISNENTENPAYAQWTNLRNEVPAPYETPENPTPPQEHILPTVEQRSESANEVIDRDKFDALVQQFSAHPAFSFEESGYAPFYDAEKQNQLYDAISELKQRVDSEQTDLPIPRRIEAILADDEEKYPFNHDYGDVTARTAHSLLRGKGSNCIGFSETCCLMLSLYGYKPAPVLSRLNKSGAACHYVTCFENNDGEIEILDPERKRSCDEAQKQYSLTAYQGSLRYAAPTAEFSKVKIGGKAGIGPAFDDFFDDKPNQVVKPLDNIRQQLEENHDNVRMYDRESTNQTRLDLRKGSMSAQKQYILDHAISNTLRPVYEQSLNSMGGNS